ncbi:MAG: hypothetical protein Q7S60_00175 [bacterium]|nr:hypothetical protein [bacterium]
MPARSLETTAVTFSEVLSPDGIRAHIESLRSQFTAVLPRHTHSPQNRVSFVTSKAQWIWQLGEGLQSITIVRKALSPLDPDGQKRLYMGTFGNPQISYEHDHPRGPLLPSWTNGERARSDEALTNSNAAIEAAEGLLEQLREDLKTPITGVVLVR